MSGTTEEHLRQMIARPGYEGIDTFVETGTLHGDTTLRACRVFRDVRTIELSRELYEAAVDRFEGEAGAGAITCYHGTSAEVVPQLARAITRPVLWYLDAHWFSAKYGAPATVATDDPFPLWAELGAIAARPFADVVAVDDVHAFGRHGEPEEEIDADWAHVNGVAIQSRLRHDRAHGARQIGDTWVVWRTPEFSPEPAR